MPMYTYCALCNSHSFMHSDLPKIPCDVLNGSSSCTVCRQISALDEKISETKRALLALLDKRTQLLPSLNRVHDTLTRRLPIETVSHVFMLCHEPNNQGGVKRSDLSRVCKTWSRITLSTPQLWTDLDFVFPSSFNFACGRLSRALSLSGDLPIDLSLKVAIYDHVNRANFQQVADLVNSQSKRWHTLALEMAAWLIPYFCGNGSTPNLHTLRAIGEYRWDLTDFPEYDPSFSLPKPMKVSIKTMSVRGLAIDWSNVTSFHSPSMKVECFRYLITCAPRLENLDIDIGSDSSRMSDSETPITLHFLRIMVLGVRPSNRNGISNIFNDLVCPSLVQLCLKHFEGQPTIASFLKRSFCSLTRLEFSGGHAELDCVNDILRQIPQLQFLEFHDFKIPSFRLFFQLLASTTSYDSSDQEAIATWFLPELQSLTVKPYYSLDKSDGLTILSLFRDPDNADGSRVYRPFSSLTMNFHLVHHNPTGFANLMKHGFDLKLTERGKPIELL